MKRIMTFAAFAVITLTAVSFMTGCSVLGSLTYPNSEKYSVGDTEITDTVENVEIDWQSGKFSIVSHAEDTVLISEKTEDGISDEYRVHWWLEGSTLHVKFASSGISLTRFGIGQKELTLTLPESLTLGDVSIRAASADIDAGALTAEKLSVSTASGDMNISCTASTIMLDSASGSIGLHQKDKADKVSIDTASGEISANLERVDDADFEAASGQIRVTAEYLGYLSANAASGDIFCDIETVPSKSKIRTVSGKVTFCLPENPDFSANVNTTSGSIESDYALKKVGNTYICGNGSADIDIETTSGDIAIRAR